MGLPLGSDSNDGSFSSPWKTIQKACNVCDNGDTVYVMEGVYTPATGQIIIENKNTANEWLTIRNYNDDYVVIDGTNCPLTNMFCGAIQLQNSYYIRISGLTINNSAVCGISLYTPGTVGHVIVDNCTISNSSASAFKALGAHDNITFEYNYVYDNFQQWSTMASGQETISLESTTTFSINNNTIINNRAETIDLKGGCNRGEVCYNEINNSGAYVYKNGGSYWGGPGIMIDSRGITHNVSIFNNNVYGNNSGISLNTESTGHYEYIYIYNNIVNISLLGGGYSMSGRGCVGLANTGNSADLFHHIYIYSNTFHTGVGNPFAVSQVGDNTYNYFNSDNLQNVYLVNNIFTTGSSISTASMLKVFGLTYEDGSLIVNNNSYYSSGISLRVYWDGTTYYTSSPDKWGNEPIFTNQQFVDKTNGNFHLSSTSPCIDTGNSILVPSFDFDDFNRPQGAGYDIGAFEFLSGYDTTPPQISGISIVTSNPLDANVNFGWENFSCVVTDNVGVDTVLLQITYPNKTTTNVLMIKKTGFNIYYSNRSFNQAGNYSYVIQAIDTSDNVALSSSHIFSLSADWDINNDGRCSILDFTLISNHYNEIGFNGWIREDMDNNGVVNILDMTLVSNHYGESWYT